VSEWVCEWEHERGRRSNPYQFAGTNILQSHQSERVRISCSHTHTHTHTLYTRARVVRSLHCTTLHYTALSHSLTHIHSLTFTHTLPHSPVLTPTTAIPPTVTPAATHTLTHTSSSTSAKQLTIVIHSLAHSLAHSLTTRSSEYCRLLSLKVNTYMHSFAHSLTASLAHSLLARFGAITTMCNGLLPSSEIQNALFWWNIMNSYTVLSILILLTRYINRLTILWLN
jgi:hypothetical protein